MQKKIQKIDFGLQHNKNRWTDFERSSEMLILVSKMPHLPHFQYNKNSPQKMDSVNFMCYWSSNSSKKIRKSNDPIRRKLYYRLTCGRTKLNLLRSSAIRCLHNDGITISVHFSRHRFCALITLNTFWTEMFPLPGWLEKLSIYQFWKDATNNKSFW